MHPRCLWSSRFFLLVITTTILPLHLALAAPPPARRSPSSSEESSSSSSSAPASVVWSSPAPGERFGPGDTIMGEWQVTSESQDQKVVSPSFRLCAGGEGGCGATIWPEVVVDKSTGYYYVSLTAPNVTTESGYYLQMKDDFGHTYTSPIFNLAPTPQEKGKPAAPEPEVAQPQPRPDQAPMSSSSSSSSSHGTKSNGAAHSDPVVPAPPAAAAAADRGGGMAPNSTASLTPGSNSGSGGGGVGPMVAAAHGAPPTAALAVPLSLAGAIVLLAGGLALHHRRKLADERERCNAQLAAASSSGSSSDAPPPSSSSSSSESTARSLHPPVGLALDLGRRTTGSGGGGGGVRRNRGSDYYGDSEKALLAARAILRGGFSDRAYDDASYHDHDRRRRPEDAAAAAAYARAYASNSRAPSYYSHGAPEPRQRTRQPADPCTLTLTREFTTIPRRRRAHPSSSSSSSTSSPSSHPSYRGILGNRCSSDYNDGGTSSLWRSLSIARRKAAPPSTILASPALTESVASVTSEFLPSYLPSPNIVGEATQARGYEHGTSSGDFGFENVPLSPPAPPPLHTRREAVEPEDSRMKELRGVYEAVAHALGSARRV